jgi:hypothetical protein
MRTRGLKVGGLRREGIPPPRPRRFWPRPHRLEGHAGRAIPAPKGPVEARAIGDPIVSSERMQNERKANGQRTSKRRNRPSPWPMLRNATVSEEDNHARFCSPAFRNRFHWWNG